MCVTIPFIGCCFDGDHLLDFPLMCNECGGPSKARQTKELKERQKTDAVFDDEGHLERVFVLLLVPSLVCPRYKEQFSSKKTFFFFLGAFAITL